MKKKKGFTLVELLVVIAILAVLATVSVVGYMGFTKKAHESNDIGLTTQMNTILQAEEVTNKPTSPHEAVQQLANGGVDVEKLTPTTDGYNYVYDLDTNRMFLLDDQKVVVAPTNITFTEDLNVFAFVGSENKITNWNGYSIYLKTNFKMSSENLFANLKTGLDVGNNTIESITYTGSSSKEALIRTNGGTLTINAGEDSVYHYGSADKIVVTAVANNSYHEFGEVKNISLTKGHVIAENNSVISQINISENADISNVKVDVEKNADVTAVITEVDVSSDAIEIKNSSTICVNKSTNNYAVFAGTHGYDNLFDAISNSETNKKIILMKDCFEEKVISNELKGKEIMIDLNGNELKFNSFNLDVKTNTQKTIEKLTFIDSGTVKGKMKCVGSIAVCMGPNDIVTMDGINLECSMYGLFPRGNAAKLKVVNSHITARVYGIATNASTTANGGVNIEINKSLVETISNDQDNTAIQINVDSNTSIKNSTIKGQRQALMVRGGDAIIENCTIEKTGTKANNEYSDYNNENDNWGQGNMVPAYAMVLGNRSNAYQYPTNVILKNVNTIGGIYCWGNSVAGLETNVTLIGTNYGKLIVGDNVIVSGNIVEK